MKKIDRLVLQSFLGPFVITFFIALFVLVMQFLWKYIDDLVGKGLEVPIIAELIFYLSASVVPMALPIAILLSSIMTFGSMGERYELVAIKSAGVSLWRFMMPLTVTAIILSGVAFGFVNYVLPQANLKFHSLFYSVMRQKPALNLKPGVFNNGIEGYIIRIGDKGQDNQMLYDIKIHDHTENRGNVNVVLAEKGQMLPRNDSTIIFKLFNGVSYEEPRSTGKVKNEYMRTHFSEYEMTFELPGEFNRMSERLFENNQKMLSVQQISHYVDSLKNNDELLASRYHRNMSSYFAFLRDSNFVFQDTVIQHQNTFVESMILSESMKKRLVQRATNLARNVKSFTRVNKKRKEGAAKKINQFNIEFHSKITIALACFVLFLVGAPLGAIIRKGGIGLPMVMAILFFVVYHILSRLGKNAADEFLVVPIVGIWMSTVLLLVFGLWLTRQALNDSAIFNIDVYLDQIKSIGKIFKKKTIE